MPCYVTGAKVLVLGHLHTWLLWQGTSPRVCFLFLSLLSLIFYFYLEKFKMADRCKWWWTATAKHCLSCCFDDSKLSLKTSFPFTGKNTIINADGGQLFVTEVRFRYCLHHWFLYGKCWNPCYKINEVKRLTLFKYPVFLVYPVRRKCANPLSLKSACPKFVNERKDRKALIFAFQACREYRGYYMAALGYRFYLRVLKVSLTNERSSLVRDTFSTRR